MSVTPTPAAKPLGKNGMQLPAMGFGSAPVADLSADITERGAVETVQYALGHGVTLFDTAPLYSAGRAERLLGLALADVPRTQYQFSSKVGRVLDEETHTLSFDFSRDGVLRSLEGTLQRLRTDHVDTLLIHDPDDHMDQALAETFPTLDDLRRQGVVRAIGAGMNQWQALQRFAHAAAFDCFLLAGRYTLLEQESLGFLDECREMGIGLLLGGVYNSGILATGAVPGARHNYRPSSPAVTARVQALAAVCARHGVALNAAALQFAQAHPAVTSLVVGAVSAAEIDANLTALYAPIPAALWADLAAAGLIDPRAPRPGWVGEGIVVS